MPSESVLFPAPTPEELATLPRSAFTLIPRYVGGREEWAVIRSAKNGGGPECSGGKALPGESFIQAARRETREELGVELLGLEPLATFVVTVPGGARHVTTAYVGYVRRDVQLRSSPEGEAGWVTAEEFIATSPYGSTFAALSARARALYSLCTV